MAGIIARRRDDVYRAPLDLLKVCTNPECPRPTRTYAYSEVCPFCGSTLRQAKSDEVQAVMARRSPRTWI
jgi:hypothetical protein